MSYVRRTVQDGTTVMNADLYNNLQDGIDESKDAISKSKLGYDSESQYFTIGSMSDEGGDEGGYTTDDILSPEDIDEIFDEVDDN